MTLTTSQDSSSPPPLELIFIPYLSPDHLVPLSEIACLFAARGEHVTVITTTDKAAIVGETIDKCISSGHPISVHSIPFPCKDVGLPEGFTIEQANDMETGTKYYHGLSLMQRAMQDFILTRRPDCIVADNFFPWTSDFAASLNIPRIVFDPSCIFSKVMHEVLRDPDSPTNYLSVESPYDPFVISGLPDPITLTRSKLPDSNFFIMLNMFREAELKSYGIIVNSMSDLDSDYSEFYAKKLGYKAFHVGPAFLIHKYANDKGRKSCELGASEDDILSWLNSKKPNSVLYISFGKGCEFCDEQLMEIACALESTSCDFIWTVQGKNINDDTWLPEGFQDRIIKKSKKGMIISEWTPQKLILDHPSTAGLMNNCEFNSVIESLKYGVPLLTWPLMRDNFFVEAFVTQVLGTGVEVGVENWTLFSEVVVGKNFIKREKIEKAMLKLLDGGDEMRRRCKEFGEKVQRAVIEGGSSQENLRAMIEELRHLQEKRSLK